MTILPAAGFASSTDRKVGESKQFLEDLRDVIAELPGGSAETELTIAAGTVTPTGALHRIDTEADAAADDLTHMAVIEHPEGRWALLRAESISRAITVVHGAGGDGQILLKAGANVTLATDEWLWLVRDGLTWRQVMAPGGDVAAELSTIGSQIRQLALENAELRGDRENMIDGIRDPFGDQTDVDTAGSTNEVFDAVNTLYEPSTTEATISLGALTKIGDVNNNSNAWFDSNANQDANTASGKAPGNNSLFMGVTLSAPTRIAAADIHGSNDQGYVTDEDPTVSIDLYGRSGSAPANATDGTRLAEGAGFTDTADESVARTLASTDKLTAFEHVWIHVDHNGNAARTIRVAEAVFRAQRYDNMDLHSNAFTADAEPTIGRLVLAVNPIDPVTLNTELRGYMSRDGGTTWTQATLAVLTKLADGFQLVEDSAIDLSSQPPGTSMKWRVETLNNVYLQLLGVVAQWN